MDLELIRRVVWLEFRLGLLVLILLPLIIFGWSKLTQNKPIERSLITYWQMASLWGISLFLLMGGLPIAYLVAWLAQGLVVLALWFWQDINAAIKLQRSALTNVYQSWRWAVTAYAVVVNLVGLFFLPCGFTAAPQAAPTCKALQEFPLSVKERFLPSIPIENLTAFGIATLVVFMLYFGSFLLFTLPKLQRKLENV